MNSHECVARVKSTENFKILITNFRNHPRMVTEGQVLVHAKPHPNYIKGSNLSMAETLGTIDEQDPKKGD